VIILFLLNTSVTCVKKLQHLEQGNNFVQDYYTELQKGMMRCGMVEETEDKICQLFQLAMLAEESQGRQQQLHWSKTGASHMSRITTSSAVPKSSSSSSFRSLPAPANKSHVAAPIQQAPTVVEASSSEKQSLQVPSKSASSTSSKGRTSDIRCHCCHGVGHVQRNFPSQRAYIATDDGGYISTSDVEDNDNGGADLENNEANDDGHVFGRNYTSTYRSIIVQRVLNTHVRQPEKLQHHNLFQIFFIFKNRRARVIIDGRSCNNLVSTELVKRLDLSMRPHPYPYHIQWLND
jgi:hypothetical protein